MRNNQADINQYTDLDIQGLELRYEEILREKDNLSDRKDQLKIIALGYNENSPERRMLVGNIVELTERISNCNAELERISYITAAYRYQTDDDEEGSGIKKEKSLKTSKWIDHVKAHSKEHNISYKQALKLAKETYNK